MTDSNKRAYTNQAKDIIDQVKDYKDSLDGTIKNIFEEVDNSKIPENSRNINRVFSMMDTAIKSGDTSKLINFAKAVNKAERNMQK